VVVQTRPRGRGLELGATGLDRLQIRVADVQRIHARDAARAPNEMAKNAVGQALSAGCSVRKTGHIHGLLQWESGRLYTPGRTTIVPPHAYFSGRHFAVLR